MASTFNRFSDASATLRMCSGRLFRALDLPSSSGLASLPAYCQASGGRAVELVRRFTSSSYLALLFREQRSLLA
jgi:hypothetical protein